MKRSALLTVAISLLAALPVQAATLPAPVIAVVDVQRILHDSTATQGIKQQLDSKRDAYSAEIKKEEDRVRAAAEDLAKNHDSMTKDAIADKQKTLRQDAATVERKIMVRRRTLDMAFADAMKQVRTALADIVIGEAHAEGANMVLPKEGTMWIDNSLDITDTVLAQLNKKLPKVAVKIEAPQDK